MTNPEKLVVGLCAALSAGLIFAGTASAAWETAGTVDNHASTAGATGSYVGLAAGGNGESTAYFEQTVGTTNGYYAIRRGPSDAAWGSPSAVTFPASSVSATLPISAGADAAGNAIGLGVQNAGGVSGIFDSTWPASGSPSPFAALMSTTPAQGGLTDPAIAFDSSGNGYAVAGEGQGASADEPILLSTYRGGAWSTPAPVVVQSPPSGSTPCTNSAITSVKGTPAGEICGQEPRLAVSPDGTVVIAYLVTVPGAIPNTSNEEVFAVRAPKGAVAATGAGAFTAINQVTQSGDTVPTMVPPVVGSASNTPPNFDVAIDGADAATIADAESQTGGDLQVEATRWDSSGIHGAVQISSANPPLGATEPRVVSDSAGDATVVWTESSQSSPPPADALLAQELIAGKWLSSPESISSSVDSPTNPQGYTVNTPPFWLAEDPSGNAFVVFTNAGALQDSIRQLGKAWSTVGSISGVSGAIAGTERVAIGVTGQADALVVGTSGSRTAALLASRFTTPVPPPAPTAKVPPPGPTATPQRKPVAKPAYRACHARPVSRIDKARTRASRHGLTVSGTSSEHRCLNASPAAQKLNHVVKVFVTIYEPVRGGRCRFLLRGGRLTRPLPCSRRIEFLAHGTTRWTLRLRIHIPPGGYLVRSDAVDGFHRHQRHSGESVARVTVRPARHHKRRPAGRRHRRAR